MECLVYFQLFFFKQKTAYEMRISDWSSDVCSSDLTVDVRKQVGVLLRDVIPPDRLVRAKRSVLGDLRVQLDERVVEPQLLVFEPDFGALRLCQVENALQIVPTVIGHAALARGIGVEAARNFTVSIELGRRACRERVC